MLGMIEEKELLNNSKDHNKIWREQIRHVEENAVLSNIVSLVVVILLALVLWRDESHSLIISWVVYMALITFIRIIMAYIGKSGDSSKLVYDFFGNWYLCAILLTSFGWGMAGYLL